MKRKANHSNLFLCIFVTCLMIITGMSLRTYAATEHTVNTLVVCSRNRYQGTAKDFYNAIKTNTYPGFKNNTYKMFYEANTYQSKPGITTKEMIDSALCKAFGSSGKNDINVFYYTGHTVFTPDRSKYGFALFRTSKQSIINQSFNSYDYSDLGEELCKYKGKFIVIIDSCYADSFWNSLTLKQQRRITCLSSNVEELETNGVEYTKAMLKGIGFTNSYSSMKADDNKDGFISVNEAHEYAANNLKKQYGFKRKNKYVALHDGAGLADFSLFQHADLKANKTELIIGKSSVPVIEKNIFSVKRNPKKTERNIMWSSSDSSVVAVQNCYYPNDDNKYNIVLNAKSEGKATITGTLANKAGVKCVGTTKVKIKVTVKAPTLKLNKTKIKIPAGSKRELKATLKNSTEKIKWRTNCPELISISSDGTVNVKDAYDLIIERSSDSKSHIDCESLNVYYTGNIYVEAYTNDLKASCDIEILPFEGGAGTKKKPYLIKTPNQFNRISGYAHRSYYQNDLVSNYYKQIADLDFKGKQITPVIDNRSSSEINGVFNSSYDGNGQTIKNICIEPYRYTDNTGSLSSDLKVGLFSSLTSNGIIKNLNLNNISIRAYGYYNPRDTIHAYQVGSIAGISSGRIENCSIKDCKVLGVELESSEIGGIVGRMVTCDTSVIKDCTLSNLYISDIPGECDMGGIVGGIIGSGKDERGSIDNCRINKAKFENIGNTTMPAGIAGEAYRLNITNCSIKSNNAFQYAFCDNVYNSDISNCVAIGTIDGRAFTSDDFFGYIEDNVNVTNCSAS